MSSTDTAPALGAGSERGRPRSEPRSPAVLAYASSALWLFLVVVGVLVGTTYTRHLPADLSFKTWVYVSLALVSTVAMLATIPGALFMILTRIGASWKWLPLIQGWIGAAFLMLLYADTRVYFLLRYHMNGAVWNAMTTEGAEDAVRLGGRVWLAVVIGTVLLTAICTFVFHKAERYALSRHRLGHRPWRLVHPVIALTVVLLPVMALEKTIYAAAEINSEREVTRATDILPLYPRIPLEMLPEGIGEAERLPLLAMVPQEAPLSYPIQFPWIDPEGPRPNVFILVIDSLRRDMLKPETMPVLSRRKETARVFEDHHSGGNGTRFGLFSMLYGLHGSYWFPVLAERRSPVMLDALHQLSYDCRVWSAASMNFPEFRQTAWVGMEDEVYDDWPAELSSDRDLLVAEAVREWLQSRSLEENPDPFFSFVLLDSPHQPYNSNGVEPFAPAAERLDYLELVHSDSPELVERVYNRYRNSVYFADSVAGQILSAIEEFGFDENTLVVVTGDHGEEFQESGFWGHTSNFSREQVEVPFLLWGPGVELGSEYAPTSHLDLPATVLEMLGATKEHRGRYCLGGNLLEPDPDRHVIYSGWGDLGLGVPGGVIRIPSVGRGAGKRVEVFTSSGWTPFADPLAAFQAAAPELEALLEECRRFRKQPVQAP